MFNQLLLSKDFDSFFNPATASFKVDINQTSTGYELTAEMPGVPKDQVEVSFAKEILTIRATKKEESTSKEDGLKYREIHYGEFERKFRLPNTDGDKIEVSLKNGVLTIIAPLQEKLAPKVIKIKD